ncbi:uncharacterized protein LOC105914116 [Setaria italica]|uniref:uncharacterized protein LOC105914116 n=1 Tax=Setaria italica TaxID=4555 RepID=UPI0006491456|nr:uncharacterized protein LOC105914116 [Setaria italica]
MPLPQGRTSHSSGLLSPEERGRRPDGVQAASLHRLPPDHLQPEEFNEIVSAPCPFHKDARHTLQDCTVLKKEVSTPVEYKRPRCTDYRQDDNRHDYRCRDDCNDRDDRHRDGHYNDDRDRCCDNHDDRDNRDNRRRDDRND